MVSKLSPSLLSSEVPGLYQAHLQHLLASGISVEVIKERGYRTISYPQELKALGFSQFSKKFSSGILMPLHAPDRSEAGHVYRADEPRFDRKKQRHIKYENVPGSQIRADMPLRCVPNARNPGVDLWITEGAKKSDALASHGACSINLNGVWGFKGKNEFGATSLLADFDLVAWKGRTVYLAYDSDLESGIIRQVRQALQRLREILTHKSARVLIVILPVLEQGKKTGVDDYLAAGHSLDELRSLATDKVPDVSQEAPGTPGQNALGFWRWDDWGLYSRDAMGAETLKLRLPLHPIERLVTPQGRLLFHIQLKVADDWRDVYLGDSWVGKRSTDASRELNDYGVPITSKEIPVLQQFVGEALRSNIFQARKAYTTLGWHNDQLCAPHLDLAQFIPPPGFDWLEDGYRVAASSEQDAIRAWQHLLEMASDAPAIFVAIGAGLAPPILNGLPRTRFISFVAHFHSLGTGSGKTSMLQASAATNGDPRKLVRTWDGTKVGLEQHLATIRHFPLFWNELGDAKFDVPKQAVMMITEERGRERGAASGGLRPGYEWRTIVVSTGNAAIAEGSAHHARRVLSIPVSLPSEEFAYECQRVSEAYFGYPLKWCKGFYQQQGLLNQIDELSTCYGKLYQGEIAVLKPQACLWALVEIGARMLLGTLGMDEGQAHAGILKVAQMSALRRQSEGIDYVQRLIDIVKEAIARDPAGFGAAPPSERPRQGNKGRVFYTEDEGESETGWTSVAVLPGVLNELVYKAGFPELTGVLIEAKQRKMLKTDKDTSRLHKTERIPISGAPQKCYVFDLSVTTEEDEGGNNIESAVTSCYHKPVFVTTVTSKYIPFTRTRTEEVGGNGGNSGNEEENTIKNSINSVTTFVTTSGNKADSASPEANSPIQKPNGTVEL